MPDISNDVGSGTASKAISATPSTNVIACTAPVISPFAKLSWANFIAVSAWDIDASNAFPISDFASPKASVAPAIFSATFPASEDNWFAAACAAPPAASDIPPIVATSFAFTNMLENKIKINIILIIILLIIN